MKEINVGGQSVFIPADWNEIEFGDYEKWYTRPPQDAMDYIRYIAGICKIDAVDLLNESVEVFEEIENILEFVFTPQFEPSPAIIIGDRTYVVTAFDSLIIGESMDIDSLISGEDEGLLSDMLGVVCRPLSEGHDKEKASERARLFRQQPCATILPVISFYFMRKQQILQSLRWSSETAAATYGYIQDINKLTGQKGIMKGLTFWQRKRCSKLTRSLEDELLKLLDCCPLEKVTCLS